MILSRSDSTDKVTRRANGRYTRSRSGKTYYIEVLKANLNPVHIRAKITKHGNSHSCRGNAGCDIAVDKSPLHSLRDRGQPDGSMSVIAWLQQLPWIALIHLAYDRGREG